MVQEYRTNYNFFIFNAYNLPFVNRDASMFHVRKLVESMPMEELSTTESHAITVDANRAAIINTGRSVATEDLTKYDMWMAKLGNHVH